MITDSGLCRFGGDILYHRLDELAITVCNKPTIRDSEWQSYLDGTLQTSKRLGGVPKLSMVLFMTAPPNATQRKMSQDFLSDNGLVMGRVALMTESILVRGAMTAFSWLVPKTQLRAFSPDSVKEAIAWLSETGLPFPAAEAEQAFENMRRLASSDRSTQATS
jgi:hypothetical protein